MTKTTLTEVKKFTKDKDGNPLKTKEGRPYTRLNIKTVAYGDKWISGFENPRNRNWQSGEEVEIEVKENGQYLNFEMPKPVVMGGGLSEAHINLITGMASTLARVEAKLDRALSPTDIDMPFPMPDDEN